MYAIGFPFVWRLPIRSTDSVAPRPTFACHLAFVLSSLPPVGTVEVILPVKDPAWCPPALGCRTPRFGARLYLLSRIPSGCLPTIIPGCRERCDTYSGLGVLGLASSEEVRRVPAPEQERLELFPYLAVAPVLAEDVSRVDLPWNVVEAYHSGRNGFACVMVSQSMPTLVQWGVWERTTLNNRFVVAE